MGGDDASAVQAEILRELRALRERVAQLEKDNQELRSSVETVETVAQEAAARPAVDTASVAGLNAGYDKNSTNGFYIKSADDQYRLNLGAYTQLRYNANHRKGSTNGDENLTQGFSMNRTRIFLEGRFTDQYQFHFRANVNDSGQFDLLTAFMQYNSGGPWSVRVGKQFMALSREDWMYAQDVLGLEFSPNDFTFAIGPSIGLQAHYSVESLRFWAGISNGAFGGEQSFPNADTPDIALTGRIEYQIGTTNWGIWDDLVGRPGRDQGILLGLAGLYQYDRKDNGSAPDNAGELIADISFNGDGYNALIGGTVLYAAPKDSKSFRNYGLLVQGGYFLTDKLEAYSRYDWISPGNKKGDFKDFNALAVGLNYFPFLRTNRWKITGELGYLFSELNRTIVSSSGALGWLESGEKGQYNARVQVQMGF